MLMQYRVIMVLFVLAIVQARSQYKNRWYTEDVVPLPASWWPSYIKYWFYPRTARNYESNALEDLKTARSYLDKMNDQTGHMIFAYDMEEERPKRTMFDCNFSKFTARSVFAFLKNGRICGFSSTNMRFGLGRK